MDYRQQQDLALEKAAGCFTESAFPNIAFAFQISELKGAIDRLLNDPSSTSQPPPPPTSIEEFLSQTACIFSQTFSDFLKRKFLEFDDLCGDSLTGSFLSTYPLQEWVYLIVNNTLMSYLAAVQEEKMTLPKTMPVLDTKHLSKLADTLEVPEIMMIPQFDGTSDQPLAPIPITQLRLKGATLKEAWTENEAIPKVAEFERIAQRNWTPSSPGGAPVFHGTPFHLIDPRYQKVMDDALGSNPTKVVRKPGDTQLFPLDAELSGIYTSFSALRSFLWSVFKGVIQDPPGPGLAALLQKKFQMRNQDFQGVILLKFDSYQPVPPGLSWYQVPVGKEDAWNSAVKPPHGPDIWKNELRAIHGQDTSSYPDVLHGKELSSLQNDFRGLPCNKALLWQTAWMSKGAELALNARISGIYAISWEFAEPAPQSAPEPKKHGRFAALTRKFGHELKKAMSKKDLKK